MRLFQQSSLQNKQWEYVSCRPYQMDIGLKMSVQYRKCSIETTPCRSSEFHLSTVRQSVPRREHFIKPAHLIEFALSRKHIRRSEEFILSCTINQRVEYCTCRVLDVLHSRLVISRNPLKKTTTTKKQQQLGAKLTSCHRQPCKSAAAATLSFDIIPPPP